MIEFDFPCSTTFRLAEAEMNGEYLRREDYMTSREREIEQWINHHLTEKTETEEIKDSTNHQQLVEQSRTLAKHNREMVKYLRELESIIKYYQKKGPIAPMAKAEQGKSRRQKGIY